MGNKQCKLCKVSKPISEYYPARRRSRSDPRMYLESSCKECMCKSSRKARERLLNDSDTRTRIRHKYLQAQANCRYKGTHPICATVDEMYRAWNGHCHICNATLALLIPRGAGVRARNEAEACIDHCHRTGIFRGWLCNRCNVVIGQMKEDVKLLEKMIGYMTERKHGPDIP